MLILNNDPDYANFAYNEMANRIQVTGPLPWDRPKDNRILARCGHGSKAMIDVRYVPFSAETTKSALPRWLMTAVFIRA